MDIASDFIRLWFMSQRRGNQESAGAGGGGGGGGFEQEVLTWPSSRPEPSSRLIYNSTNNWSTV